MGFLLDIVSKFAHTIERTSGQTLVEYAIILVLVSVVILFLLLTMGDSIKGIFNIIMNAFNNA